MRVTCQYVSRDPAQGSQEYSKHRSKRTHGYQEPTSTAGDRLRHPYLKKNWESRGHEIAETTVGGTKLGKWNFILPGDDRLPEL